MPKSVFPVCAAVHAVVLFFGCATAAQHPSSLTEGSCNALKGTWEGTLPIHHETNQPDVHDEITLRVAFGGERPKVYLVERGAWMEAKAGNFVGECLGPSAVIHAIDAGRDSDGVWVETWVLAVTARDRDELITRWIRMVNNVDLPPTAASSKFSYDAVGVLRKSAVSNPTSK
ncbi:MAG TPA: hypothetical protein VE620_14870 [Myxococcales bacterium]|jgi:hypothetical protein|nr:hypothetical protein [Myxococcales bacterium]